MGSIRIDMGGSFPSERFETSAQYGGHVAALKRAILFLTAQLGAAVKTDSALVAEGEQPSLAPIGDDSENFRL